MDKKELGQFNLFKLEPIPIGTVRPLQYKRRDFYKVMLVSGNVGFHYADKSVSIENHALVFSNPSIPYRCEHLERITGGCYCIISKQRFQLIRDLEKYPVFRSDGDHIFELDDDNAKQVEMVFQKMFDEIESDYKYKNDVLTNLVLELVHYALKLRPSTSMGNENISASKRITFVFLELLERQFPIDDDHPGLTIKSASDFAKQLNIHVNHLNRAVKEVTEKTTTQHVNERILQEAKSLLQQSDWTVAQIAYALGFKESTHFNNFFKKHLDISPTKYRKW